MGRERRIDLEGGWYHLMNRGVAHQQTFFADVDRVEFGRLLGVGHDRFGVEVHAYCLLPNHYHLLVNCPDAGLSDYMQTIGSVFTRHVNDRVGRDGPLFRGRFHSIPITTDRQLLATVRYIHRNAFDVGGISDVAQYRWSSHRTYLGHRTSPSWLRTAHVLSHFDGDREAFDQFISCRPDPIAWVRDNEPESVNPVMLTSVVGLVMDERSVERSTARQGVTRTVLLLLMDRFGDGQVTSSIRQVLEFPNRNAEVAARRRARRRAIAEIELVSVVDRVIELIG